jgi:hypothetical protein
MKGYGRTIACLIAAVLLLGACGEEAAGPVDLDDTGSTPLNYDPPQVLGEGQPGVVDDPAGPVDVDPILDPDPPEVDDDPPEWAINGGLRGIREVIGLVQMNDVLRDVFNIPAEGAEFILRFTEPLVAVESMTLHFEPFDSISLDGRDLTVTVPGGLVPGIWLPLIGVAVYGDGEKKAFRIKLNTPDP